MNRMLAALKHTIAWPVESVGAAVFTRHDDGTVTVDQWPQKMFIAEDFLEQADPDVVECDGRRVSFRVANGSAVYWVSGRRESDPKTFGASLISRPVLT